MEKIESAARSGRAHRARCSGRRGRILNCRRPSERATSVAGVALREQWRLALDVLDEMIEQWGSPKLPVAAA